MPTDTQAKFKRAIIAVLVGVLLALLCRALPASYQTPCETIVNICTGGH